jgi:hypothetical protein
MRVLVSSRCLSLKFFNCGQQKESGLPIARKFDEREKRKQNHPKTTSPIEDTKNELATTNGTNSNATKLLGYNTSALDM